MLVKTSGPDLRHLSFFSRIKMSERPFSVAFSVSALVIVAFCLFGLVEIPQWIPLNIGLHALALIICLVNYTTEYLGKSQLSYSKFSTQTSRLVNARAGWTVVYGMPALLYITLWYLYGKPLTTFHLVALATYAGHFVKRILECLFLHKYSRDIEVLSVIQIGCFYCLGAVVQHYWCHVYTTPAMALKLSTNQNILMGGIAVLVIGELINFYHHSLLAGLRSKGSAPGKYVVPSGGLFGLVICPHYFGELMGWLGMAIAGQHLCLYLSWLSMVAYLAGRSHQTRLWYIKKIENFPQERRNLYPGVY